MSPRTLWHPMAKMPWSPRPRGPIAGVWPRQKVGHPLWANTLVRPGFGMDSAGQVARMRFYARKRRRAAPPYHTFRRDMMRAALDIRRWHRAHGRGWWQVVRRPSILAAKRRAGS